MLLKFLTMRVSSTSPLRTAKYVANVFFLMINAHLKKYRSEIDPYDLRAQRMILSCKNGLICQREVFVTCLSDFKATEPTHTSASLSALH